MPKEENLKVNYGCKLTLTNELNYLTHVPELYEHYNCRRRNTNMEERYCLQSKNFCAYIHVAVM
jgi:hypothetical protein